MRKTLAEVFPFFHKKEERIKVGDMFILDWENNIYLYRPGKGRISLNGNERIISSIASLNACDDYGSTSVLNALAMVANNTLKCNCRRVYDLDFKCRDAIMLY